MQKDIHTGREHLEVAFEFRKMRFVYHEATNAFERLKFPVHEPFEYYLKATGGHVLPWVSACMPGVGGGTVRQQTRLSGSSFQYINS